MQPEEKKKKRIAIFACQQGEIAKIAIRHGLDLAEENGCTVTDIVCLMGDFSIITSQKVPKAYSDTFWKSLEIAIVNHGADYLLFYPHTRCLFRKQHNILNERRQSLSAAKKIRRRFANHELAIDANLIEIEDLGLNGTGFKWSLTKII